eukprot:745583-Amphidinium_carterae.1
MIGPATWAYAICVRFWDGTRGAPSAGKNVDLGPESSREGFLRSACASPATHKRIDNKGNSNPTSTTTVPKSYTL